MWICTFHSEVDESDRSDRSRWGLKRAPLYVDVTLGRIGKLREGFLRRSRALFGELLRGVSGALVSDADSTRSRTRAPSLHGSGLLFTAADKLCSDENVPNDFRIPLKPADVAVRTAGTVNDGTLSGR